MGKLYYFYGTMNSLKSGTLLTKSRQFTEAGCEVILLKPSMDSRDKGVISSRAITTPQSCYVFDEKKNLYNLVYSIMGQMMSGKKKLLNNVVVFVDEVNFLTEEQVQQLWELTRCPYGVSVFTYGLKNTYQNTLFNSSKKLLTLSDKVEEIKSRCCRCENKATTHLRQVGEKFVFDGQECIVGDVQGEEKYESVCQTCWHKEYAKYEELKKKEEEDKWIIL